MAHEHCAYEAATPGVNLPTVSLIVLNWNGKQHLEKCLASATALDYPEGRLQCILCDNGSTDGSVDYVRARFPTVEILALDENYGFADANNRAAECASGEWVGFLNNDVRFDSSWLRDMLLPLRERPNIACIASRILSWDGRTADFAGGGVNFEGFGFQFDHRHRPPCSDARRVLFACGGAMLIRKDIFREVGGFDPNYFAFYEDVDLGWRLNLIGHDVWYNPDATVYHRKHATTDRLAAPQRRLLYERNAIFTIFKCLDDHNLALVLPASMLLLNERALTLSGVDRAPFLLGRPSGDAPRRIHPARRVGKQRLYAWDPAAESTKPLLRKVHRTLREQGWRAVLRKGRRFASEAVRARMASAQRRLARGGVLMPDVAMSHYIALSEFAHAVRPMIAARRRLQALRCRSDGELIPLFHFALTPSYSNAEYVEFFRWLCEQLEIDWRFVAGQD